MLLLYCGELVEIVHESAYPGVLTVCSSSKDVATLVGLEAGAASNPIQIASPNFAWAIHIQTAWINTFSGLIFQGLVETVDTFTPAPIAWALSYVLAEGAEEDGGPMLWIDYSWPETKDEYLAEIREEEDLLHPRMVAAIPLWYCPVDLSRFVRRNIAS